MNLEIILGFRIKQVKEAVKYIQHDIDKNIIIVSLKGKNTAKPKISQNKNINIKYFFLKKNTNG